MNIKNTPKLKNIRSRPLIFLDVETTGLEVQKHEILEIGAVKVAHRKPFKILDELAIKVKPNHLDQSDKEALKIVKFTKKEWEGAIDLKEALKLLDEFAKGGILVGYNVSFDWAFLDKAYYHLGRTDPFYYHRLDIMPMAYLKLYQNSKLKRFSLGEMCRFYKLDREVKHRALDDAKATYLVFKQLFGLN